MRRTSYRITTSLYRSNTVWWTLTKINSFPNFQNSFPEFSNLIPGIFKTHSRIFKTHSRNFKTHFPKFQNSFPNFQNSFPEFQNSFPEFSKLIPGISKLNSRNFEILKSQFSQIFLRFLNSIIFVDLRQTVLFEWYWLHENATNTSDYWVLFIALKKNNDDNDGNGEKMQIFETVKEIRTC